MTEVTRAELVAAVKRMKRDDWTDEDRQMVVRLPPHERDTILLLSALLDAHPVEE